MKLSMPDEGYKRDRSGGPNAWAGLIGVERLDYLEDHPTDRNGLLMACEWDLME